MLVSGQWFLEGQLLMKEPMEWDEDDVARLVADKVGESLTLEFKSCDALMKTEERKREISKDVSAFANSAGGVIIYGLIEYRETHNAAEIDDGYDPSKISNEWLEQVINSNIQRRIEGLRIKTIALNKRNPVRVIYVVSIPESNRAPHMAADHRFYKRFELQSVAMEEYEVRERFRREAYPSRDIACAWRDCVINPLLRMLESEELVLSRDTWTWDRFSGTFSELLFMIAPYRNLGNQEDFLEKYPDVRLSLETHDQTLEELNTACNVFFNELKDSSWLIDRYLAATTPEAVQRLRDEFFRLNNRDASSDIITEIFGSNTKKEDHCALMAEYTINNIGLLSPYDRSTAVFWNMHRESFLQLTSPHSPLSGRKRTTDAREELLKAMQNLKALLKNIRSELSKQHGIPVEAVSSPATNYPGSYF